MQGKNSTTEISDLIKIVDQATDAIEYQIVVGSLISMIGNLQFDSKHDLQGILKRLIYEYDSTMSIELARRKCKAAITAVALALQYN